MKSLEFYLAFYWNVFLMVLSALIQRQIMDWHRPGDKPLSEPMMIRLDMIRYAPLDLNDTKIITMTS